MRYIPRCISYTRLEYEKRERKPSRNIKYVSHLGLPQTRSPAASLLLPDARLKACYLETVVGIFGPTVYPEMCSRPRSSMNGVHDGTVDDSTMTAHRYILLNSNFSCIFLKFIIFFRLSFSGLFVR